MNDRLSELFVWRKELQQLIDFATAETVSRRLPTVAGPPGYGKSWLLRRLYENLNDTSVKKFRGLFVIWVPLDRFESFDDMKAWLQTVVAQAQKICPAVAEINPNDTPEAVIGHLLQKLDEECKPKWRIIVFVDALDEPPNNLCRELENRILENFWRRDCVRMIISFRDDFSLKNPNLRRGETRIVLETFSQEQGREQLEKRATVIPEALTTPIEKLLELVYPYKFNHPGLNTLLSQKIYQNELNGHNPVLTADDLRDCWAALIKDSLAIDPGYAKIVERDLKILVSIKEDTWILETVAKYLDASVTDAQKRLQELIEKSVVAHYSAKRYKVVDGLREFLRSF
jgi:hypothetical protein